MQNVNNIQVFEHQQLRYDENGIFLKRHFDMLVKFNELHQNKYFTVIHKGIRFENYVGVLRIGQLTIEIIPKADKKREPDKILWQHILLSMLQTCRYIPVNTISEAKLRRRHHSILDIYIGIYLTEIEKLIKQGLIKKYRKVQSNQTALKGKLLFSKHISINLIHKEHFFCEHQVYDKNHLLHQILYKGLLILKNLANDFNKDKIGRLLFEFQDIDQITVSPTMFNQLIIDRKSKPYRKAIEIARILILNYSPNLMKGSENMLALLFDMNALWEEYIYRILHKNTEKEIKVSFQNSDKFWENRKIRPDIVIKNANDTFIIDTKWKIIASGKPSDNDLKQLFSYNLHWNAGKSILLYPKTDQEDSPFGLFHYNNLQKMCKTGFIDLIRDNQLKNEKEIADEIMEKLYD